MNLKFEWDPDKARINRTKHQVTFEEASTVFNDPLFITFLDVEHSKDEERYITLGLSVNHRLFMIAHADRAGQVRIISARKATKIMSEDFTKKNCDDYELREEYDLTQLPIMPKGRYSSERRLGSNLIILEPELAQAFPTDEAVNRALRLVLQAAQIPEKAGI